MKEKKTCKKTPTYIGGQAVMEGVMLRGKTAYATAVRDPHGKIQLETERLTPAEKKPRFLRFPIVRGVVNFISSLVLGNKVLMRSADVSVEVDETPSKAEKWLAEKYNIDVNGIFNFIATLFGVVLAVVIFIWLPQFLTDFTPFSPTGQGLSMLWYNLIEGGIRLLIFFAYMLLVALIPDMKRVYMYHGAEHKTITCFEEGKPLTVENVRGCARVHDRCGTTFLFIVMIVSILLFSLANFALGKWIYVESAALNKLIRIGFKLLMLPVVAGVSYEVLRGLAKTKNKFFTLFKMPGLLLQRVTTREPSDDMIECAIAAFEEVQKMDADPTRPVRSFAVQGKMSDVLSSVKKTFAAAGIEEDEAEWIFALTLEMPKSAVASEERILKTPQVKAIFKIVEERMTGRPLWYIIGDTDFCGYKIKVDERVLIPRPETEELVMIAVNSAEEEFNILDLCTGSGAIAIAVKKELEKRKIPVTVTASDVSEDALALAKENAEQNEAEVKFIHSDLFTRIRDRFHIIVTNPPYIPKAECEGLQKEVRDFEPRLALDGGEDGLEYYRQIAKEAPKYLTQGGMVIMEVGAGQAQDVVKLFRYADYAIVMKDFAGVDRFVKIVI
ncbi:MAG: peptide chain release factor N(5)-glutamine methyltransferase [Clostridia bacterium]|nr:peptide chain release factor N(5)-glutamine methyltransferase [Clostridia bacterium]